MQLLMLLERLRQQEVLMLLVLTLCGDYCDRMKQTQQPAQSAGDYLTLPCPLQDHQVAAACSKAHLQTMPLRTLSPMHQSYPRTWGTRPNPDPPGRGPPGALMQVLGGQGPQYLLAGLCRSMGQSWQLLTAWHKGGCYPQGMTGKVRPVLRCVKVFS